MKIICWINALLLALCCQLLPAQIILCKGYYLVDPNSTLHLQEFQSTPEEALTPFNPGNNHRFGYNKEAAVWLKLEILNTGSIPVSRWIIFNNIHLDSVELFGINGLTQVQGDRAPLKNAVCIAPAFELQLMPGTHVFYLRIKKIHSFMSFSYDIQELSSILGKFQHRFAFNCFGIGVLSLFCLFSVFFFAASRDKTYLIYAIYAITIMFYFGINTGVIRFILFPRFLFFSELRICLGFVSASFICLFIISYLELSPKKKKIFRLLHVINYVNVGFIVIAFIPYFLHWHQVSKIMILSAYVNIFLLLITLITSIIVSIPMHPKKAIYTLLFSAAIPAWGITFVIRELTNVNFDIKSDWLSMVMLYDSILFGLLMASKYWNTLRENNTLVHQILVEKEKGQQSFSEGEVLERKRLSNLLHDNFGSKLSAIKLFVSQKMYARVEDEIHELAADIRNLSHQIMPRSLQEGGLVSALKKHIQLQNEIHPELTIELYEYELPASIQYAWVYDVYLISQEIITNAFKHSGATLLTIEAYQYADEFLFIYTDNGKGFQQERVNTGIGLENIEFRIKNHGGRVEISSFKAEGTAIIVQVPKVKGTSKI